MTREHFSEELRNIILPLLEDNEILLVDFNSFHTRNKMILKLLVDKKEGGISLNECAALNQLIGKALEEKDIVKSSYILEVSSPGLDRSLKTQADFSRCINKDVKFFLNEFINGKLEWDGKITTVEEGCVYVQIDKDSVRIPFSKINKAKQII